MRYKSVFALILLSNISYAAVFRVGADAACTHNNLPAAVAAAVASTDASSTILLASNGTYTNIHEVLNAEKVLSLRGGYSSCGASFNPALRVTVSGAGSAGAVFDVQLPGLVSTANISFDTVIIRDGNDFLGGGINIRGGLVRLRNSEVRNNTGTLGAGIAVGLGSNKGNPGALQIENSVIAANSATSFGGGIYCDDVRITLTNGDIIENFANVGAGIYQTNFCELEVIGTGPLYVRNNQAIAEGGGAFLTAGARWLNAQNARLFVDGNRAPFGAAMKIEGLGAAGPQTLVSLQYAWIRNNESVNPAVIIQGNARFELRGGPRFVLCENGDYCSRISNQNGGAILMSDPGASLLLDGVAIQNNASTSASRGAALAASGNVGEISVRNTLITGNQGPVLLTLELASTAPTVQILASSLVSNPVTGSVFSKISASAVASVNLSHSIVHNSSPVSANAAAAITVTPPICRALVNENTSIGGNTFGRVQLSSGLSANFEPTFSGVATDACPPTASSLDLNQRARSVDLPITNLLGPQDQGAIERQSELFRDGFE